MVYRDLLRRLQGEMTQQEMAAKLGITQSALSRMFAGEFLPGRETIQAMVNAYPERREEILGVFFTPDNEDRYEAMRM